MGRKSLADERSEEILDAFERCVIRFGIDGTSLEQIADEANMKRSILRHYIGNRDALVDALVERVTQRFRQEVSRGLASIPSQASSVALLDFLFTPTDPSNGNDRIVIDVLITAKGRFPNAKRLLIEMFESWINELAEILQHYYSNATADRCRAVAYSILSMTLMNDSFLWLGLDQQHEKGARLCAEALLQTLN